MNLNENLNMAFSSVLAHKLRSILTMLGIIIGVASVIVVVAIGQGGEQMLKNQITGSGNSIEVYFEPSEEELKSNPNALLEANFTQEDIRMLSEISKIKRVVASTSEFLQLRYKDSTIETTVLGINDAYLNVNNIKVRTGQSFNDEDFISGKRVGLIGYELKNEIFKDNEAIGEIVWINNQPIEIIGVLEKPTGLFNFGSLEIYIPSNSFNSVLGKSGFNQLTLQANSSDELKEVGAQATRLLNQLHGTKDSFKVFNFEEMAAGISQITTIMTLIISSIAGISLFVGGIGVMNIMLVSVTERTREIGIRKALGATRLQILTQFLIESITLTLLGGTVGIILGACIASAVSFFAGWPSLISWQVVLGALFFSMTIGIIFGILPANKASKLNPIDSLRYE